MPHVSPQPPQWVPVLLMSLQVAPQQRAEGQVMRRALEPASPADRPALQGRVAAAHDFPDQWQTEQDKAHAAMAPVYAQYTAMPADALAKDAKAMGITQPMALPDLDRMVPASWRDGDGHWTAVTLRSRVTEIGTLELFAVEVATGTSHKLEFQIRGD